MRAIGSEMASETENGLSNAEKGAKNLAMRLRRCEGVERSMRAAIATGSSNEWMEWIVRIGVIAAIERAGDMG